MNYTKEPLQVKPYRELPQEIMFDLHNAERDKAKHNRYWFKFPENWSLTNDKERIFGLRSSYISRTQRHIHFPLTYEIHTQHGPLFNTYYIESYLDNDDTIKKFIKDFDIISKNHYDELLVQPDTSDIAAKIKPNRCRFRYEGEKCIVELYNPINSEPDQESYIKFNMNGFNAMENTDLKYLLTKDPYELQDGRGNKIVFEIGWDRYHCFITSSISSLNNNHFLAHTDRSNEPIKYYRLSSTDDKFWIDLWSTRHHNVPSIMPTDNEDEIILEAIVCFDSSAIL